MDMGLSNRCEEISSGHLTAPQGVSGCTNETGQLTRLFRPAAHVTIASRSGCYRQPVIVIVSSRLLYGGYHANDSRLFWNACHHALWVFDVVGGVRWPGACVSGKCVCHDYRDDKSQVFIYPCAHSNTDAYPASTLCVSRRMAQRARLVAAGWPEYLCVCAVQPAGGLRLRWGYLYVRQAGCDARRRGKLAGFTGTTGWVWLCFH